MSTENIAYYQQYEQNKEKSLEIAKLIQKAAKEVYADAAAQRECRELRNALRTQGKDNLWLVLQRHLHDHAQEIIHSQQSLGITLIQVNQTFYEKLTLSDVQDQVEILIGAIHAIRINKKQQAVVKECLKKLMKESGIFTRQEIDIVCPILPIR